MELKQCDYLEQVNHLKEAEQLICIETSALSGHNINAIFETMICRLEGIQDKKEPLPDEDDNRATNFFL